MRSRFSRVAPQPPAIVQSFKASTRTERASLRADRFGTVRAAVVYDRRVSGLVNSSFGPRMSHASRQSTASSRPAQAPSSPAQLLAMVRRGRKRALFNSRRQSAALTTLNANEAVVRLPRGGVYVKTRHGPVQFGIPPETIKDAMRLGVDVPKMYVVGKERFNLKFGTNTAEFEFPAYYNFFIKGSRTTVISSSESARVIRVVMDEAIEVYILDRGV